MKIYVVVRYTGRKGIFVTLDRQKAAEKLTNIESDVAPVGLNGSKGHIEVWENESYRGSIYVNLLEGMAVMSTFEER